MNNNLNIDHQYPYDYYYEIVPPPKSDIKIFIKILVFCHVIYILLCTYSFSEKKLVDIPDYILVYLLVSIVIYSLYNILYNCLFEDSNHQNKTVIFYTLVIPKIIYTFVVSPWMFEHITDALRLPLQPNFQNYNLFLLYYYVIMVNIFWYGIWLDDIRISIFQIFFICKFIYNKKINNDNKITFGMIHENPFEIDHCLICLIKFETNTEVKQFLCKHIFHKECIDIWLNENNFCPQCRQNISV